MKYQLQQKTGSISTYDLEVEILEANYNILEVLCGEAEDTLENAELKEDGLYYYKIGNVENAFVEVKPESTKSKVKLNGETSNKVKVPLIQNVTRVPIVIIAEDNTERQTYLIIEKKSGNADIIEVNGEGITKVNIGEEVISLYVDEELTNIDLTFIAKSPFASLKLEEETEFELSQITRNIDLSTFTIETGFTQKINVKAEDGTNKTYTLTISKEANLNILKVQVNEDVLKYNEETNRYEAVVPNGNKPQITIEAENKNQTIILYDSTGKLLASATGILNTTQALNTDGTENNYIIKIVSQNGETSGYKEYNLNIRQKSIETGIIYVKVDNLGTRVSADGLTYSSTVSGKEKYPVEIKPRDEKSKVRVEDLNGNILIQEGMGTINGELEVPDGETKNFKIFVTAENGNVKQYNLQIERISSKIDIESLTVTDYDELKNIVTRNVTSYDENTKTYRIVVNSELNETTVAVKTISSMTEITLDSNNPQEGNASTIRTLPGLGITKVSIKLVAKDRKRRDKVFRYSSAKHRYRNRKSRSRQARNYKR